MATYPVSGGEVLEGEVTLRAECGIAVGGVPVPSSQGTSAMLGAAAQVSAHLGIPAPVALVGGDIGRGDGTRAVFHRLEDAVRRYEPDVIAFHYMQPIMALMRDAVERLSRLVPDAALVADAGGMYAAKATGLASRFELMTPDVGEAGFLADPNVTHPAYVSHHLFGTEAYDPVEIARLAFERGGSARVLIIKGARDAVVSQGQVIEWIEEPDVPELEAIGGTGDTITGLASAFLAAGFPTVDAARCACLANREAGRLAAVTPASHASDLVRELPQVLAENLCRWGGACAV